MAGNINRVIITGNLTRDPELRALPNGGQNVCSLRVACNGRRRNSEGQWEDAPNYFDVTVWGQQGENCARYLAKGRGVAVDGRLQWREWTDKNSGQKRQSVDIIAETVQFLGGGGDASSGSGNGFSSSARATETDIPVDTNDFVSASTGGGAAEDDIPF